MTGFVRHNAITLFDLQKRVDGPTIGFFVFDRIIKYDAPRILGKTTIAGHVFFRDDLEGLGLDDEEAERQILLYNLRSNHAKLEVLYRIGDCIYKCTWSTSYSIEQYDDGSTSGFPRAHEMRVDFQPVPPEEIHGSQWIRENALPKSERCVDVLIIGLIPYLRW